MNAFQLHKDYARKPDEELLQLAAEASQLTGEAQAAVASEILRRGLARPDETDHKGEHSEEITLAAEPSASDWRRAERELNPPPRGDFPTGLIIWALMTAIPVAIILLIWVLHQFDL